MWLDGRDERPERPRRKRGFNWPLIVGLGVVAAAAVALGSAVWRQTAGPGEVTRASSRPMTFGAIFERVAPAVVSVEVVTNRDLPLFGRSPDDPQDRSPRSTSAGSGFFITPEGLVLTNAHVVEGARSIAVSLNDGRRLPARLVGRDENVDLAVLKVADRQRPNARYPYVDLEEAAKPRVGEWILAVGNPFGLGGTATAGIVSAYGRDISAAGLVDYVQLDAAINRGDFGGPTFDIYGRFVGVNTAILSPSGGSIGISFAIPADVAAETAEQLASGRQVQRGFIGATIQTLSPELAAARGMEGRKGALVAAVARGGPAERAGLRSGDVVVRIQQEPIETSSELTRQVARAGPNKTLRLEVVREGRTLALSVRTGVRPPPRDLDAVF